MEKAWAEMGKKLTETFVAQSGKSTLAETDSSVSENIQAARLFSVGAEKSISEGQND